MITDAEESYLCWASAEGQGQRDGADLAHVEQYSIFYKPHNTDAVALCPSETWI